MHISRTASHSLDALRLAAALAVFLHHANWLHLDGGALNWFARDIGHSAVVVFFVLSGYVIAAASTADTALSFAIKRASRILTVAVPALLLTLALDLATLRHGLAVPVPAWELRQPVPYLGMALLFAGDFWGLAISAFSNTPFWSLNYEVWYYVLFAAWSFGRGPWRLAAVVAILALIGPKLWVLLPVWAGGVALYRLGARWRLSASGGRWLALGAALALVALKALHVEELVNAANPLVALLPLRFSQWFLGDYLIALPTLALVHGLVHAQLAVPPRLARGIVAGAGISFSLYLVHYPVLAVLGALVPGPVAIVLCLLLCIGFGLLFEPRRDLMRRMLTLAAMPRPASSG